MIEFTQYMLPDGRRKQITMDVPDEIQTKYDDLRENGYHFDAEILTTGIVSFTCERGDELLGIELSENGPNVVMAVRDLIIKSHASIAA